MQSKTTVRYLVMPVRMAVIQKSTNKNSGDSVEKRECSYTVGGTQTNTATMENSVEIPWKTGNRTVIWRSNPTAGHTHWGKQNWKRHVYPNVHRSTVIIARTWKLPRCPSAEEWIRKQWYIYTMEYYLDIKKNTFESVNEVDETGANYTEWSKPERKTSIQYTNAYIWNLERW